MERHRHRHRHQKLLCSSDPSVQPVALSTGRLVWFLRGLCSLGTPFTHPPPSWPAMPGTRGQYLRGQHLPTCGSSTLQADRPLERGKPRCIWNVPDPGLSQEPAVPWWPSPIAPSGPPGAADFPGCLWKNGSWVPGPGRAPRRPAVAWLLPLMREEKQDKARANSSVNYLCCLQNLP